MIAEFLQVSTVADIVSVVSSYLFLKLNTGVYDSISKSRMYTHTVVKYKTIWNEFGTKRANGLRP
jgi:hypothetical protein